MSPYHDPHVSAGEIADYLYAHHSSPMPDLLPCPFCGVTPIVQPCQHHGLFITCENHDCLVAPETTRDYDTAEQAAEVWNTRLGPVFEPAVVVLDNEPQLQLP